MSKQRILITGSGGFIGSHVVEAAVRAGHDVRALVNYNSRGDVGFMSDLAAEVLSGCEILATDIRDAEAIHAATSKIDAVFHLAALIGIPYSYAAPSSYVGVNVEGTLNLLNAARRQNVGRFIHTSTSEVYGSAQYTPMNEAHPLVGQSPYSASKIGADKIAESFALSFELPVTILRPFNTFGPRQSARAVIPVMARQLLDPSSKTVQVGTLSTVRDFTYVEDTARAYVSALDHETPNGITINLGTGVGRVLSDVYERLEAITGITKPVAVDADRMRPERSEVAALVSDNSRARDILDWIPHWDFDDGLREVIAYCSGHARRDAARYLV